MKKLIAILSIGLLVFYSCSKDKVLNPLEDNSDGFPCELQFKITQPESFTFNRCMSTQGIYVSSETSLNLLLVTGESDSDATIAFQYMGNGRHIELNRSYNLVPMVGYDDMDNPQDSHGVLIGFGPDVFPNRSFGVNTVQGTITYTSKSNNIYKGVFNFEGVETIQGEDVPGSILKVVDGSFTSLVMTY